MTLRFSTARATRVVLVLLLGSAATAAAQPTTRADSTRMRTSAASADSTRADSGHARRMRGDRRTARAHTDSTHARTKGMRVRKDSAGGETSSGSMPVTKDQAAMPAPARDTTAMTPPATTPTTPVTTDTATTSATTTTETAATTTTTVTTETSGGEVIPMPARPMSRRIGNGFYIGVGAGAAFPQNALNDVYRTGYNIEVPIGWDPPHSPLGVRANLGYGRLRADNRFNYALAGGGIGTAQDAQVWQGELDAKLNLPFGHFLGATSNLYAVGGGGAYYFKNYGYATGPVAASSTTGSTAGSASGSAYGTTGTAAGATPTYAAGTQGYNSADRSTRFGANVGGGVSWGIGAASLYVESRYIRVFQANSRRSNYVPLILGVVFH